MAANHDARGGHPDKEGRASLGGASRASGTAERELLRVSEASALKMSVWKSSLIASRIVVCNFTEDDTCLDLWNSLSNNPETKEVIQAVVGQVFVTAFDTLDPYVKPRRHGDSVNLTGYLGDLWTILEAALGFRSAYVPANGNAARLMLESGTADVFLAPTVVTAEEDDEFDHTQPVISHWYQLFVRKGAPEVSADSYVRAMSPTMWALTLCAVLVLSLALRGVAWLRGALGMPAAVEPAAANFSCCFMAVLGSVCAQGWQGRPRCPSARVAVVTTLLFAFLVYNAYAAVLISHLASGRHAAPFASLQEVADKRSHVLCVRNESYAYLTLRKNYAVWRHVLNRGACQGASHADTLVRGLCDHNAAVLEIPSVMAAALDARPDCRDHVLHVNLRRQRAAASLLLRKGFPFTRALDHVITQCRVTGVLSRLEGRYLGGRAVRSAGSSASNAVTYGVQVSLDHVRWVLGAYGCCLCAPLLVLAGECVVAWRAGVQVRRRRLRLTPGARAGARAEGDGRNLGNAKVTKGRQICAANFGLGRGHAEVSKIQHLLVDRGLGSTGGRGQARSSDWDFSGASKRMLHASYFVRIGGARIPDNETLPRDRLIRATRALEDSHGRLN